MWPMCQALSAHQLRTTAVYVSSLCESSSRTCLHVACLSPCRPTLQQSALAAQPLTSLVICLRAAAEHRRRQESVFAALGHGPRSPGQQRRAGAPQPRGAAAGPAGGMPAQGEARGFLTLVGQPPAPRAWRGDPGEPERVGGEPEALEAAAGDMHEGGGNHMEDAPEPLAAAVPEPDQVPGRDPAPSPGAPRDQADPESPGCPASAAAAPADPIPAADPEQAPQGRPAPGAAPAAWDPGQGSGQGPVRVSYRYGALRRAAAVRVTLFLRSEDPAAREARTCSPPELCSSCLAALLV